MICYVVLVAASGFQIYIFTYHSLSSTFIIPLHRYCKNLRVVYCFLTLGFFAIIVVGLITYLNILFTLHLMDIWASLVARTVKNLPAMWVTWVQSLGWEDPLEGGHGNPLQYSCLENPHGQRSLVGYTPWGHKELDTSERLNTAHTNLTLKSFTYGITDVFCLSCCTYILKSFAYKPI